MTYESRVSQEVLDRFPNMTTSCRNSSAVSGTRATSLGVDLVHSTERYRVQRDHRVVAKYVDPVEWSKMSVEAAFDCRLNPIRKSQVVIARD